MGFVPQSGKIILHAYFTQLGREKLIKGTAEESKITHFGVGDSDTIYSISVNINNDDLKNILTSGFIPDLTGDQTECIKSVADGIAQKYFVKGSANNDAKFIQLETLKLNPKP